MSNSQSSNAFGVSESEIAAARGRLESVQERIARAAQKAGRDPSDVTLVGVAKKQPQERILAAIGAGLHVLGQSYVQEARRVRPEIEALLSDIPRDSKSAGEGPGGSLAQALEWRMVGQLQRNKAGLAARLFDAVESVDRPELAEALSRRAEQEGRTLEVLIQLSLCDEPQKGGCAEDALTPLAETILALPNLKLTGLMTVPAASPDPEHARPTFAKLRALLEELGRLDPNLSKGALSMGMSGDLEVAVEEGATLVRVGTALFGERVA